MTGGPIDVAIVEDNDVFREALQILLDLEPDVRVVAAVSDGRSALDACRRLEPHVVVVDYRLPDLDGVETTRGIRETSPDAAIVVLTADVGEPEVDALLDAGAVSCLTKDRELAEIVDAIRVAAGRSASAP